MTTQSPEATTTATAEQIAEQKEVVRREIKARFDNTVDVKSYKFHFKKVVTEVKDDETGKIDKIETKRPTIELELPTPSVEGIIKILEEGDTKPKNLELLLEIVADCIAARARELINDDKDETLNQANFPLEKLSWEAIANLPKAERRGGGISKETWADFAADYIAIMPAVTNKNAEQIGNAAKILLNKFASVKTNKPVLKLLQGQIGLYVTNSPNAETYQECVAFLQDKVDALINMDDASLLANL